MSAQVDDVTSEVPTADDAPTPRRRRGRRIALVVALVVLLLVAVAGWVAFRAVQAGGALLDARDVVVDVRSGVDARDTDALEAILPQAQDATARARAASSDPVWRVVEHVPWVGDQLRAVRTVSAALDDVTHDVLPAVGDVGALVEDNGLRRADGSIDIDAVSTAVPRLHAAAVVAAAADASVGAIDTSRLVGRLAGPVDELADGLAQVSQLLTTVDRAAAIVPSMAGADGPRTYLVLALNSAELRSAGGIVGTVLEVKVDDGRLSLGRRLSTADLPGVAEPVLPLTDAEKTLYGNRLGQFVQNAVETPDFPRAAELITARWKADVHGEVDGVIGTDPVAVKELLGALGPVEGAGGRSLDSDTILQVLLSDTYRDAKDSAAADATFSSVAGNVFGVLTGGAGASQGLADAVFTAASDGHFRVWSAHADEQAVLAATGLGSAFLSGDHPDAVGVFLNDATEGKLDYYLSSDVGIACASDASTATVTVTLSYAPPSDVLSLPDYVLGGRHGAIPDGSLGTSVFFYAPVGAPLDAVRQGDVLVAGATADEGGRRVVVASSVLAPGQSTSYQVTVPVRSGVVEVWTTPTLTSSGYVRAACPAG